MSKCRYQNIFQNITFIVSHSVGFNIILIFEYIAGITGASTWAMILIMRLKHIAESSCIKLSAKF